MTRTVPYNIDAEESVIASLMLDDELIGRVMNLLQPGDFYREKHTWIYEALIDLYERHEPVDLVTVADELDRRKKLGDVGGPVGLSILQRYLPTAIHGEHYARIVLNHAILRKLIGVGEGIIRLAVSDKKLPEILTEAEASLFAVTQGRASNALRPISTYLTDFYREIEELYMDKKTIGLKTGLVEVDRITGGLQKGDLILLAARPSMGKTSLALSITESIARQGATVAFFSLEMNARQIIRRLAAHVSNLNVQRLQAGPIYDETLESVGASCEHLKSLRIWLDDTPAMSVSQLRSKLRPLEGLDLIVVDYLQLMTAGKQTQNRVQELSFISRSLKELAKEFDVPILALCQLSRGVESRQDKRPMLSDLRGSGTLEQDADLVLFIYRDEVYNKQTETPGIAEIIIAKHRNGPTGVAYLRFLKEQARFCNLEQYDYEEEQQQELEHIF